MRAVIGIVTLVSGLGFSVDGALAQAPENKATVIITMMVPEGAEVSFDGTKTTQTGTVRKYYCEPINTDKTFKYRIRVVTPAGEDQMDISRALSVRGGERITLDFRGGQVREIRNTGSTNTFFEPGERGTPAPYAPQYVPSFTPRAAPFSPVSPRNMPWAPNG
jgi:uncharacterized protein (TIGR03000 family)